MGDAPFSRKGGLLRRGGGPGGAELPGTSREDKAGSGSTEEATRAGWGGGRGCPPRGGGLPRLEAALTWRGR